MPAADRFFVDTNVLLHSVDPTDAGKQERGWEWLPLLWEQGLGSLSWQVLHEFYGNALNKLRVAGPEARKIVRGYSQWAPVETTLGLIVSEAERAGCRWLQSEDFQAGRRFGAVTVVNPFLQGPEQFGLRAEKPRPRR